MRLTTLSLLAAAALVAAEPAIIHGHDSPLPYSDASTTTLESTSNHTATPTRDTLSTPSSTSDGLSENEYDRLPNALKQFIIDMSPKIHLEDRQNAAPGGGAAAASPQPTQLSPITVYTMGGVTTYTQTFASVPDQFPSPSAGTIGLGSIQGTVGTVRTYSNPAPTATLDPRMILAVAGGIGAGMIF